MTTKKVNFVPQGSRVLVEAAPAEVKTSGGIIIPDSAQEKPQHGTIVAVGTGKKDEPMTLEVGHKIIFGKYSGSEVNIDGTDYLIMRQEDVLGNFAN